MSRKLLKSTAVTGSMTLLSRFTGLARDVVLAHVVGAGLMADVFFVAFRIPNFFRRISGEGAFSQAFVPVFSEYHERRSAADTHAFLDRMAGWFGGALLLATLNKDPILFFRAYGRRLARDISLPDVHFSGGDVSGCIERRGPVCRAGRDPDPAQSLFDRRRPVSGAGHG